MLGAVDGGRGKNYNLNWGKKTHIDGRVSLNAIVDVRLRRRHEMILNISKTIEGSNFKIYHNVAQDSLYIKIENDVTIYFRSAANRINVSI